jgi:hypothetical protein
MQVGAKHDPLGGSARDGRLLDDDLGRLGDLGDSSGSELEVAEVSGCDRCSEGVAKARKSCSLQVGGETSSDTRLLGGGVDRDEDEAGEG